MSKKSPTGKPTIHITKMGGWYVDAGELLRSEAVRKQIDKMAQLAEEPGTPDAPRKRAAKSGT